MPPAAGSPRDSSRPPRQRPTRAQTRRRILDAALTVFGRDGIQAGSLDTVAAEAQLSKGAIYSNFASKDDLVVALVRENALYRVEAGVAAVAGITDPHEVIVRLGQSMMDGLKHDQVRNRLVVELYTLAHRNPQLHDAIAQSRRQAREVGARHLQEASEQLGFALPLPAQELIVLLLALSNGFAIEWGIDHDAVPDHLMTSVLLAAVLGDR